MPPSAAMESAAVGVASPNRIEPSTARISNASGRKLVTSIQTISPMGTSGNSAGICAKRLLLFALSRRLHLALHLADGFIYPFIGEKRYLAIVLPLHGIADLLLADDFPVIAIEDEHGPQGDRKVGRGFHAFNQTLE